MPAGSVCSAASREQVLSHGNGSVMEIATLKQFMIFDNGLPFVERCV